MFVRRFIRKQSTAALGRALPFGIGAVVGGGAIRPQRFVRPRDLELEARTCFMSTPPSSPSIRAMTNMFVRRFIRKQSTAALGRALPFGIGAVVGGGANLAMSSGLGTWSSRPGPAS
jgi:F0F1-type ATP synthase membrane subunit c/vacuolar-type H+-ATPase subunit K